MSVGNKYRDIVLLVLGNTSLLGHILKPGTPKRNHRNSYKNLNKTIEAASMTPKKIPGNLKRLT